MAEGTKGLVFDIQDYTIHDGPGIRTEIFLKGCNMHCPWCSNPESILPYPQLGIYPDKCIGEGPCAACRDLCPMGESPIKFDAAGKIIPFNSGLDCSRCLMCADECPADAVAIWGREYSVEELLALLRRKREFFERSGGGVTINGGEALMQWQFVAELAAACRAEGINVCVETALNCPTEQVLQALENADYIITDIKHMSDARHRELTGRGNEQILANIRTLVNMGKRIVIRTPLVPGYNDEENNIFATAAFIRDELGGKILQYQLIPYRKLGSEKCAALGRDYPMGDYTPQELSEREITIRQLQQKLAEEYKIPVVAGASQPWR